MKKETKVKHNNGAFSSPFSNELFAFGEAFLHFLFRLETFWWYAAESSSDVMCVSGPFAVQRCPGHVLGHQTNGQSRWKTAPGQVLLPSLLEVSCRTDGQTGLVLDMVDVHVHDSG